jgi:hypothetical protein
VETRRGDRSLENARSVKERSTLAPRASTAEGKLTGSTFDSPTSVCKSHPIEGDPRLQRKFRTSAAGHLASGSFDNLGPRRVHHPRSSASLSVNSRVGSDLVDVDRASADASRETSAGRSEQAAVAFVAGQRVAVPR